MDCQLYGPKTSPKGSKKHCIDVIFRFSPVVATYGYKSLLLQEITKIEWKLQQYDYYNYKHKLMSCLLQKTNDSVFTVLNLPAICVLNLTFSLVNVLRSIGQNAGGFLENNLNKLLRSPVSYFTKERFSKQLTSELALGKTRRIDVRNLSFERDLGKQVGKSDTNNPQKQDLQNLHHILPFATDLKEQPMAAMRNNSQTSSQHQPPSLCLCSKSRVNKLLIYSHDYPIGNRGASNRAKRKKYQPKGVRR